MKYDFSKMVMKGGKIVQVRGGALVPMVNGEGPEPIVLPKNTIRLRFYDKNEDFEQGMKNMVDDYTISQGYNYSVKKVENSEYNDWDFTCNSTNNGSWNYVFSVPMSDGIWTQDVTDHRVDIIAAGDLSDVTSMNSTFAGISLVNCCELNTVNVTSMKNCFAYQAYLTKCPKINTTNVTDMSDMFSSVPLEEFPNISFMNVENAERMFMVNFYSPNYPTFKNIPESVNMPKLKNCKNMFQENKYLEAGMFSFYSKIKNNENLQYNEYTFYNCGTESEAGQTEMSKIPSTWGGTFVPEPIPLSEQLKHKWYVADISGVFDLTDGEVLKAGPTIDDTHYSVMQNSNILSYNEESCFTTDGSQIYMELTDQDNAKIILGDGTTHNGLKADYFIAVS